ncbi:peptidylprolyl isomerase [Breznakiella homolactica]|uniref:Peptidylprolyl isomerase n=1 Tax=Breznakiella homolactica TaxID=2798577 RepID=A0A7T7XMW1_9SPIR|nr:peptidylprolyl isomerase [Breznakiella homolactica]QQO09285.1 peptidylprolyl isomerase [Breznakiella homolactica]
MKRTFFLTIMVCAVLGTAFAQSDLQPAAIVRLTKSEPITVKQLRTAVEQLEQEAGKAMTPAERRQVLDILINNKLAMQAAERDGVTVSDGEINQQIQQFRTALAQNMGRQPTDAEFELFIRNQTGYDLATFRTELKQQATIQRYLVSQKRDLLENIPSPTDAEVTQTYNLIKARNFVRPHTVRVSVILVPKGTTADERTKAKELADKLARDIGSNPSKFDEAVIRANAPSSGYQGGDGGYIPQDIQVQQRLGLDFANTVFALRQGEVSKVIETPRGYEIIKITETLDEKILELDDIIEPGTKVTVKEYLVNTLLQQRQQQAIDTASHELITELRKGNTFQVFENNINW